MIPHSFFDISLYRFILFLMFYFILGGVEFFFFFPSLCFVAHCAIYLLCVSNFHLFFVMKVIDNCLLGTWISTCSLEEPITIFGNLNV